MPKRKVIEIDFNIKTKEEQIECLMLLEDYKQTLFKKNPKALDLSNYNIILDGTSDKTDFYITALKNLEIIQISTSIPLEQDFIEVLYSFFSELGLKSFVLDCSVNDVLSGGIVFQYKGYYYDLSIDKLIKAYVSVRK